jgi:malonate transporter MadL subunit
MAIYGVALLSACTFLGVWVGRMLGGLLGLSSDVGGIGFAMLLLMIASEYSDRHKVLGSGEESGIKFWSAMYIPIVVAMSMNQNVIEAVKGGPCAIVAGLLGCLVMFPLIKPISKLAAPSEDWDPSANPNLKK